MFARKPFELLPDLTFPSLAPAVASTQRPAPFRAQRMASNETRPNRAAHGANREISRENRSPNLLFSRSSTLLQKSAQLTENKQYYLPLFSCLCALFSCKPFAICSLRILHPGVYTGFAHKSGI